MLDESKRNTPPPLLRLLLAPSRVCANAPCHVHDKLRVELKRLTAVGHERYIFYWPAASKRRELCVDVRLGRIAFSFGVVG